MKTKLLLFLFVAFSAKVYSQSVIKNASFETWNTYKAKLYPANWVLDSSYIKNDYIKRISGGSNGSYALHLGSYLFIGEPSGTSVFIQDSLTSTPGALQLDYKIFNNTNNFTNGLYVQTIFYNKAGNLIAKYDTTFGGNESSFKTGQLNFNLKGLSPYVYLMTVLYKNTDGKTDEYAVVDNLRFTAPASIQASPKLSGISIFPNPSKNVLNISNPSSNVIDKATIISMDGKVFERPITNNAIDISKLNNGIYILEIVDTNGNVIKREKFSVIN